MLRFLFKGHTVVSSSFLRSSEPLKKFFSNNSNNSDIALNTVMWEKMGLIERMNLAMTNSDPKIAEIAYYKGLGFKKLGTEFSNEAITAFNKAMELDEDYKATCEREVAAIYQDLGMPDKAIYLLNEALDDVVESPKNLRKIKELKTLLSDLDTHPDDKSNKKIMRAVLK